MAELTPHDVVAANPVRRDHLERTADIPVATAHDVIWADAVVFGSLTRFGSIASGDRPGVGNHLGFDVADLEATWAFFVEGGKTNKIVRGYTGVPPRVRWTV